jgi:NAD(P)-dependent dehydrogenase (short-subunit alcohol dehydrogenase family)
VGLLDGKVAIITGGGSGIGKGIADIFSQENCSVVIAEH